jgi:hypothetical protein
MKLNNIKFFTRKRFGDGLPVNAVEDHTCLTYGINGILVSCGDHRHTHTHTNLFLSQELM